MTPGLTLMAEFVIRSSVVLGLGLLAARLLRRRSAALRHRVLVISLLAALLVGPLSLALPEWPVTVPSSASLELRDDTLPLESAGVPVDVKVARVTRPTPGHAPLTSWPAAWSIAFFVWIAGAVIMAGALGTAVLRTRRLIAGGSRVDDAQWVEILGRVAAGYELTRAVTLTRTASPDLLATCGWRHPRVLLPRHSRDWAVERAQIVLAHELAHVRRNDWLAQMAGEAVRVALWFNPLVWIVCRQLRRESELACDDDVLNAGVGGREYAGHLLELVRQCRRFRASWVSVLPMAHPSTLERRIAAMLNPQLDRRAPSRRALAVLGAVLLLVTIPLASVRARQVGPATFSGTVYDVSGAVVPGVNVTLTDSNEVETTAQTNANGRFEFPVVAAGAYGLSVKLAGFRTLQQQVELRQTRDWDRAITLQLGTVEESVVVRVNRQVSGAPSDAPPPLVRVGGSVRPPRKIKDVRPSYPASMVAAGLGGVVPIEAVIGVDGSVTSVRVLTAPAHPDLANAALEAVRQWRFTPTLLNGQPVELAMTVRVTFDIAQ